MVDQPDELVIELKKPIKNKANDSIERITLREPTGAEWRKWDKLSGVDADIKAVSVVSSQPEFVIEQMVTSQLTEAAVYLAGFLRPGPQTGGSD